MKKIMMGLFVAMVFTLLVSQSYASLLEREGNEKTVLPKMVFAHYMVCCPPLGETVEMFKIEIKNAQKHGIDGFALNSGGWSKKEPFYKKRTKMIYEAARQLGSGFKLFVSMDFCCGNDGGELRDAILEFKNHPNQLRVNNKPVISTFDGDSVGSNRSMGLELARIAKEAGAVYLPYYYPVSRHEIPNIGDIEQLFRDYSQLDGYFYFGAAGSPSEITSANKLHAEKWTAAGKIFMAGITPFYRGATRIFDTRGFNGMATEWEGIIRDNINWVQIVTWNDFSEASYLAPYDSVVVLNYTKAALPHYAYLEASQYFIDWFKSGIKPPIIKDQLFYFYRPEPKPSGLEVIAATTRNRSVLSLEDSLYVTVFLKKAADVTIYSGNIHKKFKLSAGVQHIETPYSVGKQRFVMTRGGVSLIDKEAEMDIKDRGGVTAFNYFAGSAEANAL